MNKNKLAENFKNKLKININFYRQSLEKIKLRLKETQGKNSYSVNPLLCDRNKTNFLLKYLKELKNNTETVETFTKEFNLLDIKFNKIKKRKDFLNNCLKELECLTNNWEHVINHVFPGYEDFTHDLEWRDDWEAVLIELEGKKDISELKKRIKEADSKLQSRAAELLKKFPESYENKEWDYYPKTYWWRHLKEFVEEKKEAKK